MSINKALKRLRKKVEWNGEEAAEVRGLSPADIATLLSDNSDAITMLLSAFEEADKIPVAGASSDTIAQAVLEAAPSILGKAASALPELVAELIARAADDASDEAVEAILEWPTGLQAQALIEIASMTFAGPEGFRMFVGNVAALVKTVNTMTSASEKTAVPPGFKRGSPAPTTSAGG